MAWTNLETKVIGGVTYVHQRGDQITDLGHRLTANGTAGTAAPLNRLAESGAIRAAVPEFDLADQSGMLAVGIFTTSVASALTAGVLDLVVTNANTITADGAVQGASVGVAVNGSNGFPLVQAIVFANAGGANPTTAGYIDVGGGATIAQIAAKIKAAVDLGPAKLANIITTAIATTGGTANNTVRITAVGLGAAASPRAWSLSDGLTVTQTAGT